MVFDEKTRWSWDESRDEPRRDPGMFYMRWGETVDAGEGPTVIANDQTGSNEFNDLEHHNHEHEDDNNTDEDSHSNHDNESNVHH